MRRLSMMALMAAGLALAGSAAAEKPVTKPPAPSAEILQPAGPARTPVEGSGVHRTCTITRCPDRCPKGEWRCNGRCISKMQACRLVQKHQPAA